MKRKETLETWLRQQIFIHREDVGHCIKIELGHLALGGKKSGELYFCKVPEDPEEGFVSTLLTTIEDLSQADVEGLGGVQTYAVFAYFEDKPTRPTARYVFKLRDESEANELESEPPSKEGITAQLMRHNEAIMRSSSIAQAQVMNALVTSLQRLSEQNEQMSAEKLESLKTMEELYSHRHERELELLESQAKQERIDKVVGKLDLLAPVLINKLGGGNGEQKQLTDGNQNSVRDAMLGGLANSITPEQLSKLQGVFSDEQMATLLELVTPHLNTESKNDG